MFSVTYTGMNFRPLCTANVCPIISGTIVERRDQVFTTRRSFASFRICTFFMRWRSTNGPFLIDRAIVRRLLLLPSSDDVLVGRLVVPRLVALRRLAPRRLRVIALRSPLTATVRMVDGVHR